MQNILRTLFRSSLHGPWMLGLLSACITPPSTPVPPEGMVRVPGGVFTMGFTIENPKEWGDPDEEPVHEVFLDTFYIDKYETTAAAFAEFLNAHPDGARRYFEPGAAVTIERKNGRYQPRPDLESLPANRISWYGADAYCRWKGKRLPTEAQWEKAARGTEARLFPWGNRHPDDSLATYRRKFKRRGFRVFEAVDSMPQGASPYGVHHMAGNVWEWVDDWYAGDYYERSPEKNPPGPATGSHKVLRGGNWYYKAYYMRTTYRFNDPPGTFKVWQGVRCAWSP